MFNPVEGEGRPVTAADVAAVISPGEIPVQQGDGRQRMVSTLDRNESMVIVIYTGGTIGMKATRRDDCEGAWITNDAVPYANCSGHLLARAQLSPASTARHTAHERQGVRNTALWRRPYFTLVRQTFLSTVG